MSLFLPSRLWSAFSSAWFSLIVSLVSVLALSVEAHAQPDEHTVTVKNGSLGVTRTFSRFVRLRPYYARLGDGTIKSGLEAEEVLPTLYYVGLPNVTVRSQTPLGPFFVAGQRVEGWDQVETSVRVGYAVSEMYHYASGNSSCLYCSDPYRLDAGPTFGAIWRCQFTPEKGGSDNAKVGFLDKVVARLGYGANFSASTEWEGYGLAGIFGSGNVEWDVGLTIYAGSAAGATVCSEATLCAKYAFEPGFPPPSELGAELDTESLVDAINSNATSTALRLDKLTTNAETSFDPVLLYDVEERPEWEDDANALRDSIKDSNPLATVDYDAIFPVPVQPIGHVPVWTFNLNEMFGPVLNMLGAGPSYTFSTFIVDFHFAAAARLFWHALIIIWVSLWSMSRVFDEFRRM